MLLQKLFLTPDFSISPYGTQNITMLSREICVSPSLEYFPNIYFFIKTLNFKTVILDVTSIWFLNIEEKI